jgi:hypothetical protein
MVRTIFAAGSFSTKPITGDIQLSCKTVSRKVTPRTLKRPLSTNHFISDQSLGGPKAFRKMVAEACGIGE